MVVGICYKNETGLDNEEITNVEDIQFYENCIEITFNDSENQLKKEIIIIKSIPRELLNSFYITDLQHKGEQI